MTTHKNSCSWPDGAESRLNSQSFVKKWHVADPNIIFEKNQELVLLPLTCKPSPVPAKSVGACAKFKIYLWRCRKETRVDISILDGLLFMWGVLPSFRSRVYSRFTKNSILALWKIEKALFVGGNKNQSLWHSLPSQCPRACPIWPHSDKLYAMIGAKPSSFDLKVMQPRTW
jgi:hypothetical protein